MTDSNSQCANHGSASEHSLVRRCAGELAWWTDPALEADGVTIAFSERGGGVSSPPFDSLNVAAHVGDASNDVDVNRGLLLEALGLGALRGRLVTAEQVHGSRVHLVCESDAGRGAFAVGGPRPVDSADALATTTSRLPLMLMYADCVPVVIVAPGPAVTVAHAGWRGALAGIPAIAAQSLAALAGCEATELRCYVGAHIGACHYETGPEIMSLFVEAFGTLSRAESGGLDLGFVVAESLTTVGVDPCRIASLGICTAEATDRFFSYRAQAGPTGRHCALACIHS